MPGALRRQEIVRVTLIPVMGVMMVLLNSRREIVVAFAGHRQLDLPKHCNDKRSQNKPNAPAGTLDDGHEPPEPIAPPRPLPKPEGRPRPAVAVVPLPPVRAKKHRVVPKNVGATPLQCRSRLFRGRRSNRGRRIQLVGQGSDAAAAISGVSQPSSTVADAERGIAWR